MVENKSYPDQHSYSAATLLVDLDAKPLIAKWVKNDEVEVTIKQPSGKSEQVSFAWDGEEWK